MKKILLAALCLMIAVSMVYAEDAKKDAAKSKTSKEYIADLSSKDENMVVQAADWLGKEEEKAALPELARLLKNDGRVKVRVCAAIALGLIRDESVIDTLNGSLTGDSNADVRYSVLLAISRIGSPKSLEALKKAKQTESDPYIKDYLEKLEAKLKEKK